MPLPALPLLASALLPLAAQVGPFTAPGTNGTPLPERVQRRPAHPAAKDAAPALPADQSRLQACLAASEAGGDAAPQARAWLAEAQGHDAALAGLCLGVALSRAQDWNAAEQAFTAALASAGSDRMLRARLGAMAGNAAIARGDARGGLADLDTARTEAAGLADPNVLAPIELDRGRALVALGRPAEAETAFAAARQALPNDADVWLFSATLSRRQGHLAEAQTQIERAAELRPVDPAIGLEAGVIAVLAARPDAARKSWQSVIAMAPDSDTAKTARGYLAQIGTTSQPTHR